jgi:hypothetical protein
MKRRIVMRTLLIAGLGMLVLGFATAASRHSHHLTLGNGEQQVLTDGQNHSGIHPANEGGMRESCESTLEPFDNGSAGSGLQTAHHGPHAGQFDTGDACDAVVGNPQDNGPALDE